MITGYNTDVRHGNRIFHVQTEDKGLTNPRIETLIYVGGEILDSYRGTYEDLITAGIATEASIQSRMDEQHKGVIRDIKNGKYDQTPPEGDLAEQQIFHERAQPYLDDPTLLRNIVADGCDKARKLADETMREVREAMGLLGT